jgi:ParB family chromosome partitioning protein
MRNFQRRCRRIARNNALNFNLPSVDDLFSTEERCAEARLEKVVNLNPSEISDFPDYPFKVRMDAAMQEMAESVKQYGVLVPALVRPKQGGYEMVAGHRRKMAAELAQLPEILCIVRSLTDDEDTIIMVDSNLQREQILPSEKAFAYKMKLDAMKRQGQRTDLISDSVGWKLNGKESAGIVGKEGGDSQTQVRRYIRLTHLIPDILELVDNSVLREPEVLQIAMRPAVEMSYLRKEEQADLFAIMEEMDCTPSNPSRQRKQRPRPASKLASRRQRRPSRPPLLRPEPPELRFIPPVQQPLSQLTPSR